MAIKLKLSFTRGLFKKPSLSTVFNPSKTIAITKIAKVNVIAFFLIIKPPSE
jgi:hypothetical protein